MGLDIKTSALLPSGSCIRLAQPRDDLDVRSLDNLCFPPDSPDLERAALGELEAAIRAQDVLVLERDGSLLAYLQADTSTPNRIYFPGLAVHPSVRRMGLGSLLVSETLSSLNRWAAPNPSVVTVTSPRNRRMLRVLFKHGFAVRWILRDFFGPDRHRFGLQLRSRHSSSSPGDRMWVPVTQVDDVFEAVERLGLVVRAEVERPGGAHFELDRPGEGEFPPGTPPPTPGVATPDHTWKG